ncbi:Cna B-type domain-containing protein [Vagococcus penaei]|nr:Cna B-type domain-containing protein [Vagococcus penaei]
MKKYIDSDNANNTRPDSITVILEQNGEELKQTTIKPDSK